MIAKHVPMNVIKKSKFVGLVNYITHSQSKHERVGQVTVTNCHSSDPHDAVLEIEAKQALNKRSRSDKTYHLIISFAPNENPSPVVLKAIEAQICEGLGFREHQRISAVHHDTDNLHIHLAINKIHPTKLTNVTPYYDHKELGKLCERLEIKYGLVRTNHKFNQQRAASQAIDMERAAGIESLVSWIRRECLEALQQVTTWTELRQVLREHGLTLRERGAGFVFGNEEGIYVKASSVAREFSKNKLEGKLGAFEPTSLAAENNDELPKKRYQEQPIKTSFDTSELYARYQQEQRHQYELRATEWKTARDTKNRELEDVKRRYRLKRATIKFMVDTPTSKKILYRMAFSTFKDDMEKVRAHYTSERKTIYQKYTRRTWVDWLQQTAKKGDEDALNALRSRRPAESIDGDALSGENKPNSKTTTETTMDSITKMGTIIYRAGESAIRDDGDKLKVAINTTQEGLIVALKMAVQRYGKNIIVKGSGTFKKKIVYAAAISKMGLRFQDNHLEKCRQELILLLQENAHDQKAERQADRRNSQYDREDTTQRNRRYARKPRISKVGKKPPPEYKDRLRKLSELGMVYDKERDKMLLSGNVSSNLEHRRTDRVNGMRREIYWKGWRITESMIEAATKYITEREEKRKLGVDIPKHDYYEGGGDGTFLFAGIRRVNEQALVLLKQNSEIRVLPLDESTENKLKKLSIGDPVTIEKDSVIKVKRRGRKL